MSFHGEDEEIRLSGHDGEGRPLEAAIPEGADPTAVIADIRAHGGRVMSVEVRGPRGARPSGVSSEEFALFNDMLASAIEQGIPLFDGVRELARTTRSRRFRRSLEQVAGALERGEDIGSAFDDRLSGFPALYGRLLQAGAAAGNLPEVLMALSRNIRLDASFRRGVIEALVYPCFVIFVCIMLLVLGSVVLVPNYELAASQLSTSLPWVTEFLTLHTPAARITWALVAGVLATLLLLWAAWFRRTRLARSIGECFMRRMPLLNRLYEAAIWSGAADTLALLIQARVPLPAVLRLVGPALDTEWTIGAFARLADGVESGKSLRACARAESELPRRMVVALDSGDTIGDIAAAMRTVAKQYRKDAARKARNLLTFLPPALALIFGVVVFIVAMAVLMPILGFLEAAW